MELLQKELLSLKVANSRFFPALGLALMLLGVSLAGRAASIEEQMYRQDVTDWRQEKETSLKQDNGWLTLAGRFVMKTGENRFGTAADNDIVFPANSGPGHMGSFRVEPGKVTLKLTEGMVALAGDQAFTERPMGTSTEKRDWVSFGHLAMHVIERDGAYVLRLADNESEVRKQFPGRVWYAVKPDYRVVGRFVAYQPAKKIPIINVLGEAAEEASPGYVEFQLDGHSFSLDAIDEDDELFFIFRDGTSGQTTYPPGRFLVAKKASDGKVVLDFNKAYNPPCAFSEFTTCPLPPRQNQLKVRVEAGERDYKKKLAVQ